MDYSLKYLLLPVPLDLKLNLFEPISDLMLQLKKSLIIVGMILVKMFIGELSKN